MSATVTWPVVQVIALERSAADLTRFWLNMPRVPESHGQVHVNNVNTPSGQVRPRVVYYDHHTPTPSPAPSLAARSASPSPRNTSQHHNKVCSDEDSKAASPKVDIAGGRCHPENPLAATALFSPESFGTRALPAASAHVSAAFHAACVQPTCGMSIDSAWAEASLGTAAGACLHASSHQNAPKAAARAASTSSGLRRIRKTVSFADEAGQTLASEVAGGCTSAQTQTTQSGSGVGAAHHQSKQSNCAPGIKDACAAARSTFAVTSMTDPVSTRRSGAPRDQPVAAHVPTAQRSHAPRGQPGAAHTAAVQRGPPQGFRSQSLRDSTLAFRAGEAFAQDKRSLEIKVAVAKTTLAHLSIKACRLLHSELASVPSMRSWTIGSSLTRNQAFHLSEFLSGLVHGPVSIGKAHNLASSATRKRHG